MYLLSLTQQRVYYINGYNFYVLCFYVLLTLHLIKIFVNNQLDT